MATSLIDAEGQVRLERVPTSIPGLDTVLRGGFLQAGTYLVQGAPGTGKTILANQFCFNHSLQAPCGVRDADVGKISCDVAVVGHDKRDLLTVARQSG
jgi:replicative DNA helicase